MKRTCPGCGLEYVQWTDFAIERGYRVERRWDGCPRLRDATTLGQIRAHGGVWVRAGATPLVAS